MAPPWRSHRHLDPLHARAALAARGLVPADARIREIGRGWDNAVLAVDGWLLRVSVRPVGDPLLHKEIAILDAIGRALPVPTPRPKAWGPPGDGLPGPWMLYRPLPGMELATSIARGGRLTDPHRLGAALRALHSLDASSFDLPRDPNRRTDPSSLVPRAHAALDDAIAARLPVPADGLRRLFDAALGARGGSDVVCHGDLHLRHVLVDGRGRLTGLIDWGDACRAPACLDLGLVLSALSPADQRHALAAYGPVERELVVLARLFGAYSALLLMLSAHDDGPRDVVDAARAALRTLTTSG